jgi:hypothetical protein
MPDKKTPKSTATTSNPRIQIPRGPELTAAIANLRQQKPGLITESSAAVYAIINYVDAMGDERRDKYDNPMNACPFADDNDCHIVDARFRLASLEYGHTIKGTDHKLFSAIYDHVHYWHKCDEPFAITMQPYLKANDKEVLKFVKYCQEHHLTCRVGHRKPVHHESCLWIEVTRDEEYDQPSTQYAKPFGLWLLEQTDQQHKVAYQDPVLADPAVLDFVKDMRSDLALVTEITPKNFSIAHCCTPRYRWCSGAIYASIALRDAYATQWIESHPHEEFIATLRQRQQLTWAINTQFKRHHVPMRSYGSIGRCHASVDFEHENVAVRFSIDQDYHHLSELDALKLLKILMATATYGVDFYSIIYPASDRSPETALEQWLHELQNITLKPLPTTYVESD